MLERSIRAGLFQLRETAEPGRDLTQRTLDEMILGIYGGGMTLRKSDPREQLIERRFVSEAFDAGLERLPNQQFCRGL